MHALHVAPVPLRHALPCRAALRAALSRPRCPAEPLRAVPLSRSMHVARASLGDAAAASEDGSQPQPPAWLRELIPHGDWAAMLRRDPKLPATDPAAAAAKLAALRVLVPGRDVTKMVILAPELLRQESADTRALFERLQKHFRSSDVAQMVFNRPQLLLTRTSAAMLAEWAKRERATSKRKKPAAAAAAAAAAASPAGAPDAQAADAPARSENEEAAAAARRAIEEIVASGRPAPRGFGRPPPLEASTPASPAPQDSGAAADEDAEEVDAVLSDSDVAEFEAALAAATAKAQATRGQAEARNTVVQQIEARWAARKLKAAGKPQPLRKAKGAHSDARRERVKAMQPWLAAPWARRDAQRQKSTRAADEAQGAEEEEDSE